MGELCYIGLSNSSIARRLWQHLSPTNNRRFDKSEEDESYCNRYNTSKIPLYIITHYSFLECNNPLEVEFLEKLYIWKYKPFINLNPARNVHNKYEVMIIESILEFKHPKEYKEYLENMERISKEFTDVS